MKFKFTHHANQRIFNERNISAADIRMIIQNPDGVRYEKGGLVKCAKLLDKGELVVVYSKGRRDTYVIITAYFK